MKTRYFEELLIWQDGIKLVDAVYDFTRSRHFKSDRSLRDQLRRAAVSVPSNIAEGYERNANSEFLYLLSVAKGSAGELRSLLYVARNAGYLEPGRFDALYQDTLRLSARIYAFMVALQRSPWKGVRYRRPPTP